MVEFWTLASYIAHNEALRVVADSALKSALAAQKELVAAAFAASEKAIQKAEDAQRAYNANHNDLSRKMEEREKETITRREALDKIEALQKQIAELRESRSEVDGKSKGADAGLALLFAVVGLLLGGLSLAVALYRVAKGG